MFKRTRATFVLARVGPSTPPIVLFSVCWSDIFKHGSAVPTVAPNQQYQSGEVSINSNVTVSLDSDCSSSSKFGVVYVCLPDGSLIVSSSSRVYGSDARERRYWGGGDYSAWIDYGNSLPAGLLQRFYVFAQPTADTKRIGTGVSRIQVWRQRSNFKSYNRAFQLVWERRVLVLPCNSTHGALHVVIYYTFLFCRYWKHKAYAKFI